MRYWSLTIGAVEAQVYLSDNRLRYVVCKTPDELQKHLAWPVTALWNQLPRTTKIGIISHGETKYLQKAKVPLCLTALLLSLNWLGTW